VSEAHNRATPKNDANYQWDLTSGAGGDHQLVVGGSMAAGEGSMAGGDLTGGGDSTSGSSNDFFRNLFGAGQAPNPDYEYEFDSQQGSGNFMPGGVDSSSLMVVVTPPMVAAPSVLAAPPVAASVTATIVVKSTNCW